MTSKNWSRRSGRGCAIISLLSALTQTPAALAQTPAAAQTPAIAVLDAADAVQWQTWTKDLGWAVIAPKLPEGAPANPALDLRVQALAAAVKAAVQSGAVDGSHVYLAGRGEAAA